MDNNLSDSMESLADLLPEGLTEWIPSYEG